MRDRGTATLMERRLKRNLGTSMGAGSLLILKGLRRVDPELGVGSGLVASMMSMLWTGSGIILSHASACECRYITVAIMFTKHITF